MTDMTGLYIHVPFCAQKCPYCDFFSGQYSKNRTEAYLDAVCRNLETMPQGLDVDTIYFGGGTPSLLTPAQIAQILEKAASRCTLHAPEITLEANPRTLTDERLSGYLRCGVNRLSIGVQSFEDETLQILGRRHSAEQAKDAVVRAKSVGFTNISIDLMLGLQSHTAEYLQRQLDIALALPITHLSVYLLKIEDGTPFAASPPAMLSEDDMVERYLQMHEYLESAGFSHYEISNFAKEGYESRHNCKYWRCEPYFGIGPAAHSCYGGKRFAVPRNLDAFCTAPTQPTEITDEAPCGDAERIMLGLRLKEGIAPDDYPTISAQIRKNAAPLIPKFVQEKQNRLALTAEGFLVSNAVITTILRGIL